MDTSVGAESHEVDALILLGFLEEFLEDFIFKEFSRFDLIVDFGQHLFYYSSATDGDMSDLRSTGLKRGESDTFSVCFEFCAGTFFHEFFQKRSIGLRDGIAFVAFSETKSVEDDEVGVFHCVLV